MYTRPSHRRHRKLSGVALILGIFLCSISQSFALFFFTTNVNNGLVQFDDDGSNPTVLNATGANGILSVDSTNNDIYYPTGLTMRDYDIATKGTSTVTTAVASISGIDAHAPTSRVYYAVQGSPGNRLIKRVDFGGSNDTTLLSLTNFDLPVRASYDSTNNRVYWTDLGSGSTGINYINATTGAGRTNIGVSTTASGLDIDNTNQKVYWTEPSTNLIRRSNLNGSSVETVASTTTQPWGVTVDEANSRLYWIEGNGSSTSSSRSVYQSNLDGSSALFLFTDTSLNGSFDIDVNAIPEPSTYALIFSSLALGVALWIKRKKAA